MYIQNYFKIFQFKDDIFEVKDLKEGMICPGLVTNVTNFGAFVDIGVHQDGLVHISELAHKFVEDPRKVVNPGDQIMVKVLKVDLNKNQIALSMKMEDKSEHTSFRDVKERGAPQSGGRAPQAGGRPQQQGGYVPGGRPLPPPGGGRGNYQGGKPSRDNRSGGTGSGSSGGGHRDQKPAGSPFNNPFAALLNQNKK